MFGDERARPKEISLFLVWLQCQGWAVSKTKKLETHVRMCSHPTSDFCKSRNYWVSNHTSNISKIVQSDPEIRRWGGARAHVQRCPTPPMTCGKHVLSDPQPTYQIWTQSVKPFLRYRSAVCTCARAEIFHPWLVLSTLFMIPNSHTKIEPNRPSRSWDTESWSARAHVQRHPTHDLW